MLRAHWRPSGDAKFTAEDVRVVELQGAERDAVVKTYASTITCNCLRSMQLLPDPADHPVFPIEPTATWGGISEPGLMTPSRIDRPPAYHSDPTLWVIPRASRRWPSPGRTTSGALV